MSYNWRRGRNRRRCNTRRERLGNNGGASWVDDDFDFYGTFCIVDCDNGKRRRMVIEGGEQTESLADCKAEGEPSKA
jgi:hypothetical protein